MAAEADILEELRRLRARVPQLTGALATGADGLVLAQDTPGVDPRNMAALTATARGLAAQLADATGQGDFRELLVRGVHGYVATYAAGSGALLTLLAEDRVNVGRLHLEGRRAVARIGELVEATAAPGTAAAAPAASAAPAPTTAPAKPPAKAPAKTATAARTRTPRTPRTTTTTNARTTTES
ncbi:roadblock/LC7 domain-containing protein [Streptomyces sp. V4I2]|uniref:roadblock/LC7 domain-containing protein n=1 Tax=Streptomyces sp. V4I2 TaxID=3042280 RepID=UPI0027801948|nr:roadblock/LC7 domain-containing protein [Streptomyces sp. V4I2]MDQ1046104.1 putative regulator of Ras-like GTPase activity (Roadblock/LC7/MglB family) [Streptomyces sp. V4I2]